MSEPDEWDDRISIHRENDGSEYLVIELGRKWWASIEQTHLFVVPLDKIEGVKQESTQERVRIDALLRSALGTEE